MHKSNAMAILSHPRPRTVCSAHRHFIGLPLQKGISSITTKEVTAKTAEMYAVTQALQNEIALDLENILRQILIAAYILQVLNHIILVDHNLRARHVRSIK